MLHVQNEIRNVFVRVQMLTHTASTHGTSVLRRYEPRPSQTERQYNFSVTDRVITAKTDNVFQNTFTSWFSSNLKCMVTPVYLISLARAV